MNTWNLRTEILAISHRWYWVISSFFLGALLGWIVSLMLPAPYRAVQDIYVGLNAYRATRDLYISEVAGEQFRNLDDYKNWQMGQLNSLSMSDEYLFETLNRLQSMDVVWLETDLLELRMMLDISWRNTGDWHFSAKADTPIKANQVVSVWSQVVIEKTALAVDAARQMVVIDSQLQSISDKLVELETRYILLQETQSALEEWKVLLKDESSVTLFSPLEHWSLISQVVNAAGWNVGWFKMLEDVPSTGSSQAEYLNWLLRVMVLIDTELGTLPVQIQELTNSHEALAIEYTKAADDSRALSANLEVQNQKSKPPDVIHLRSTETLILVGGGLGILIWGLFWLWKITRRVD